MRVHINLPASNLKASTSFYAGLFGAPSKVREDYVNWRLDSPGLHLALVHAPRAETPAATDRHYGVEVFDHTALEAMHAKAKDAGIDTRVEEAISCCYAVGDKFWATDPDGNSWEFWVRTGESEDLAPTVRDEAVDCCGPAQSSAVKSTACCTPSESVQ